eukprot:gene8088-7458_t
MQACPALHSHPWHVLVPTIDACLHAKFRVSLPATIPLEHPHAIADYHEASLALRGAGFGLYPGLYSLGCRPRCPRPNGKPAKIALRTTKVQVPYTSKVDNPRDEDEAFSSALPGFYVLCQRPQPLCCDMHA